MILFVLGITIFIESFRFEILLFWNKIPMFVLLCFNVKELFDFRALFLCYVLASSCKLDFVYRCCSALFETSCEIVHCVQLIFIILLTTILLCKVSPSGVGKGAHPVCLNIFFRLFGCSCSGFKNSMPYGWKTYWTSLAVTHLLLGCCFYARKISINI